jgi:hypothetical protein
MHADEVALSSVAVDRLHGQDVSSHSEVGVVAARAGFECV